MSEEATAQVIISIKMEKKDDSSFLTSEMLDERKEAMLSRNERLLEEEEKKLPTKEIFINSRGKKEITELIYNSKTDYETPSVRKYKTQLCKHWPDCENGDDCWYAHGEEEKNLWVEAYCGLALWHNKAKLKTLEHFELCQNQLCPLRLRCLLRKTVICKYWEEGNCLKGPDCCYAHGKSELKPLPKYELCGKYLKDLCALQNTECVYAHGWKEKRKEGATIIREDQSEAEATTNLRMLNRRAALEREISVDPTQLCDHCKELEDIIPPQARDRYVLMARGQGGMQNGGCLC